MVQSQLDNQCVINVLFCVLGPIAEEFTLFSDVVFYMHFVGIYHKFSTNLEWNLKNWRLLADLGLSQVLAGLSLRDMLGDIVSHAIPLVVCCL